jgi:hypothetical protein
MCDDEREEMTLERKRFQAEYGIDECLASKNELGSRRNRATDEGVMTWARVARGSHLAERKAEVLWRTVCVLVDLSLPVSNQLSLRESGVSTNLP